MAIKIGQLWKDPNENYLTDFSVDDSVGFNTEGSSRTFLDYALQGNWQKNSTYYIKLKVKRIDIYKNMGENENAGDNDPHNLNIDIKLYQDATNKKYQSIGEPILIGPYLHSGSVDDSLEKERTFLNWCKNHLKSESDSGDPDENEIILPAQMVSYQYELGTSSIKVQEEDIDPTIIEYYEQLQADFNEKDAYIKSITDNTKTSEFDTIELVFTPIVNAQFLVFELRRVGYDYSNTPRILEVEEIEAYTIKNILPVGIRAKKIGVQSNPGTLVVINMAPMRIGKSGVLEIDVGIDITSVGFAAAGKKINEFILDYMYEE